LEDLSGLRYITLTTGKTLVDNFNNRGRPVDAGASDEEDSGIRFVATTTRSPSPDYATGHLSELIVQVTFQDDVNNSGTPIQRTVWLTRLVTHG